MMKIWFDIGVEVSAAFQDLVDVVLKEARYVLSAH